jgi:hypothetical protein
MPLITIIVASKRFSRRAKVGREAPAGGALPSRAMAAEEVAVVAAAAGVAAAVAASAGAAAAGASESLVPRGALGGGL